MLVLQGACSVFEAWFSPFQGNPVQLLENLAAIKARHSALCAQVEDIAAEQKRSMDSIRAHLDTTVKLVEELQNTADIQVLH